MELPYALAALAALVGAILVLRRVDPDLDTWWTTVRSRLLMGVPWGTLVAVAIVLFVYLLVQSGYEDLRNPVVIPFQSWSYTYPTGWLTGGLAHSGLGHLLNNVTAILVLGSIAEFAYGHFPRQRGRASFSSYRTNPYVRAFIIVPAALVATALFSALFAIGPVIGFSGVVFAVGGFALIRYPLATVLGLFAISAIRRLHDAVTDPVIVTGFVESGPAPPWWAEVAIQGHAIGLLLGLLAGIYVFRRRETAAPVTRLFAGVLLFAVAQNLWAVYWFHGTDQWILLRGIGIILVIALAVLVAVAVTRDTLELTAGITTRQLGVALLAIALALLIGPAIPLNLTMTDPGEAADRPGIEVDDYRVIYAEDIVNRMVAVGDIDFGGLPEVRTSGVIVYSEERDIWTRAVSTSQLADRQWALIPLGDAFTRTDVFAQYTGWDVHGNDSVYQVWLWLEGSSELAFEADRSTADVRIANHTVDIASEDGTFVLDLVYDNETVATTELPEAGESVSLDAFTVERVDDALYIEHDGTRIQIASRS